MTEHSHKMTLQHLADRLSKVEDRLNFMESEVKPKHFAAWRKLDPAGKLEQIRETTKSMLSERLVVLNFNHQQRLKIESFDDRPLTWNNDSTGEVYNLVTDVPSWYWLTQSTVAPAKLTPKFTKIFNVLVIDEELVTLSRDFRDGLGECIMWTPWRKMRDRAPFWKIDPVTKTSKIHVDPRVGILDPVTNKPWVGVDESESDDESDVSDVSDGKSRNNRQTEDSGSEFNPEEEKEEDEEEEEDEDEEEEDLRKEKKRKIELTYSDSGESNQSADEGPESSQGSESEKEELREEVKSKYHGQE